MKYTEFKHDFTNVAARRCSVKKELLRILQNSQENTRTRVSSLIKLQAISKNNFFYGIPRVAASPNRDYLHCAILKTLHAFQEKKSP